MEISDPYIKYKFVVKKWENDFIKKYNRNPGKDDIRLADQKVRNAYKNYWKIKTSLLESTLVSNLDDTDDSTIDEQLFLNNINDQIQEIKSTDDHPKTHINNLSVWGEHLNKVPIFEKKTVVKTIENSVSKQLSKKLFDGCDFKKRNPRKSFVKKKTSLVDCSQNLSDNITCIVSNNSNIQEDSAFHEDFNLSGTVPDSDSSLNHNIKILNSSTCAPQPLSILQKSSNNFENSSKLISVHRKLDEGWLERCNENNSKIPNLNIILSNTNQTKEIEIESDTDIVYGSDNETQDIPLYSSQRIKAQEVNYDSQKSVIQEKNNEITRNLKKRYNSNVDYEECLKLPKVSKSEDHKDIKLSTKDNRKKIVLEAKMSSGKVNENFVKLDMKRKIYSRGKRSVNTTTYKKKQWKNKKKELGEEHIITKTSLLKCFKCGDIGHYSKNCLKNNELIPLEDIGEDESPFLTLEQAEILAAEKKEEAHSKKWARELKSQENNFEYPSILEDKTNENVSPVYHLEDNSIIDTPNEVYEALKLFGHTNFRPGQEKAIMRILSGLSTLVTLSTGSGKSLCYQLPAYLYSKKSKCITLVISPLISLMEDQVNGITAVNIACLHNNQTPKEREIIIEKLSNGELSILLVSPESVVSGFNVEWLSKLPPIAFVCLDEAHCLSQWSHNFRPSYLMICQVLRDKFGVKTFMGLTATATVSTISCIAKELMLDDDPNSIIKDTPLPNNLMLSVSRDKYRDKVLIDLLNGNRFINCNSIIVYCIRRDECERVASLIRTSFQLQHINGKRGQLSQIAEAYHAGLSATKRKRIQKYFMDGQLKIVVATIAFGMGINKSDVQGIIHYNMTKSLESYVQEIGRAGRDGNISHCHMFLDSEGDDIAELSRHIYSNSVERASIRKLLERVFIQCQCKEKECIRHEIVFDIEDTVTNLDMKQENIQTLLCYLELNTNKLVKNLPLSYTRCKITCYKGPLFLKQLSKTCPPLAVAYALEKNSKKSINVSNQFEFSIFEVTAAIGWDSGIVKKELKKLEWTNINGTFKKSGVTVEFSSLGFRVLSPGNMNAEQLDLTLCNLYSVSHQQEIKSLSELSNCYKTFMSASTPTYYECCDKINVELCEKLKKSVREYFILDNLSTLIQKHCEEVTLNKTEEVRVFSDVNRILNSYVDCKFTARAIARIFHGIESPNFPAYVWGRSPFWRLHIKNDFNAICKVAQKQIISNLK